MFLGIVEYDCRRKNGRSVKTAIGGGAKKYFGEDLTLVISGNFDSFFYFCSISACVTIAIFTGFEPRHRPLVWPSDHLFLLMISSIVHFEIPPWGPTGPGSRMLFF